MPSIFQKHVGAWRAAPIVLGLAATSCGLPTGTSTASGGFGNLSCSLPAAFIADGGPGKDGIPALTNPVLVPISHAGASYLRPDDRVIGIELDGQRIAVPLNIGWWHEIVNLNGVAAKLAVTHCPLTGSSLVFDRTAADGAEFGVSGLLYLNNLMMYDRASPESLWPQMIRGARCGRRDGVQLPLVQSIEMRWDGWRTLHPDGLVVSSATGHARNYQSYPYGDYASLDNTQLLAPIPQLDVRRPPKERVLGIIAPSGATLALPFGRLRTAGESTGGVAAISVQVGGTRAVVLWDNQRESAAAFRPELDGAPVTLRVVAGRIVDAETNSEWAVTGVSVTGPRLGQRLAPAAESFVAYWFAWSAFYPESSVWSAP